MKVTKDYLKKVIKEELERINEGGERHGQVIFDDMFLAMLNTAPSPVDPETLAHQITQYAKLKQGQEVNITMDDAGVRWNGKLVAKGDNAAADFAHRIKSRLNAAHQGQANQPQQNQPKPKPAPYDPSAGHIKAV